MQEHEIFDLLGRLFERVSAKTETPGDGWRSEKSNREVDPVIAMQGISDICLAILERAIAWTDGENPEEVQAMAGEFLANVYLTLEKQSAWLKLRSPHFGKRVGALKSLSHLLRKGGKEPNSRYMLWVVIGYERLVAVRKTHSLITAYEETGIESSVLRSLYPFSGIEAVIPEKFEIIQRAKPEQQEETFFRELLWPWLRENREEIERETWAVAAIKKRASGDQWKPSFSNLQDGFRKAWATFYRRPESGADAGLIGIERTRLAGL